MGSAAVRFDELSVKKVLAISPYFPPANTPDMQRLRMALPYFAENGWEVTVATADPSCHSAPRDEALAKTVPAGTRVLKLPCWSERKCRRFGFGHLSNRIAWPWRGSVARLLAQEHFDLVFFTTTQALVLLNGPYWQRVSDVPYVIDLQDPIYVPGGSYRGPDAPGGRWKYRASRFVSRFLERRAFSCPSAVMATSRHYIQTIRDRYPRLANIPMETLPFGVPEADLRMVDEVAEEDLLVARTGGRKVVFYAGRGGPDLRPALGALFSVAADLIRSRPEHADKFRFVFLGTSYGPIGSGARQVEALAGKCGCGRVVLEDPERKPYFEVLKATKEADCALVVGSESASYTASKALTTLAAARKVLAVVHRDSLVCKLYSGNAKVLLCSYERDPTEPECVRQIENSLLSILRQDPDLPRDTAVAEGHTARNMTARMCQLFALSLQHRMP